VLLTKEQWEAILKPFTILHHPEVLYVGIPALAALIWIAVSLWLIHKDLLRIAEVLGK
jgi:hypothetical protein